MPPTVHDFIRSRDQLMPVLKVWDLVMREVPGGSNCFFHSLLEQLRLVGVTGYTTVRQLKEAASNWAIKGGEVCMSNGEVGGVDEWCRRYYTTKEVLAQELLRNEPVGIEGYTVAAAAVDHPIDLYNGSIENDPEVVNLKAKEPPFNRPLLRIGFPGGRHFCGLRVGADGKWICGCRTENAPDVIWCNNCREWRCEGYKTRAGETFPCGVIFQYEEFPTCKFGCPLKPDIARWAAQKNTTKGRSDGSVPERATRV